MLNIQFESNIDEVIRLWDTIGPTMDAIVIRHANEGLDRAYRRSTNQYMVQGALNKHQDPANPPPGPLKKRTRRLASAVFIRPAQIESRSNDTVIHQGSLNVNLSRAPYGLVHENGGRIRRGGGVKINGRTFSKQLGPRGGRRRMRATTDIMARPYMQPSMDDEFGPQGETTMRLGRAIDNMARYY